MNVANVNSEENKTEYVFEELSNEYFGNGGAKIRRMSDSVLKKIGFTPDYPDEFYSLAGETFISTYETWNPEYKFDTFLFGCLMKRFITQIKKDNALKRGGIDKPESINKEIGEDLTLEDTIGEEQIVDRLSPEMTSYLKSLNSVQKKIYLLLYDGYEPKEIQEKLGITSKIYNRELRDARAYDKVKILRQPELEIRKERKEEGTSMSNITVKATQRTFETTTVSSIQKRIKNGSLRDDNPLQRSTDNWNNEMKGNLIVTALLDEGLPPIVICERKIGDLYVREIIDGIQRCSTFIGFMNNTFRISKKVEKPIIPYTIKKGYDENGEAIYEYKEMDVRGKKFSDLPEELQSRIEDFNIHCDVYLKCSNEDVEYHIRRLNCSRSMNHSQRGLTFVGSTLAMAIKKITRNDFFRDTYKITDKRNGNNQRLVFESVMLINFEDDWVSAPEKIGAFLNKNATVSQFEAFNGLVNRVDDILDDETRKLFNMRDSFVWFRVFNDFTKTGLEDERFNDFLKAFDGGLKDKCVNYICFEDLCVKSTKDISIISRKVDYLETLMYEYLGVEKVEEAEEDFDLQYGEEVAEFVENFQELDSVVSVSEENCGKIAVKTALALKGKEDLSNSSVQESLDNGELTAEDMEDALDFTQDFMDDWAMSANLESEILREENLPILVRLYKTSCESDVKSNRAQNWFVNLADQEELNPTLVGDYQKDWATLKKKFNDFVNYERQGAA